MIRLPSVQRKRNPKKKSTTEFDYVIKPRVIKICFVGNLNSGKTSLIRKYLYDEEPRHYQTTIGYDFDIKLLSRQNKDVRLEIYDTGHPIYNDMIFNCISVYSIEYIVICYDLMNKNSFKVASDWIEKVKDFGNPGRYKIVICGTKSDILDNRQKSILATFLVNTYRNGTLGYFESSTKSDQNIDSEYNEDLNRNYLDEFNAPNKRACVRRGGNCDHRPNDCCYNSSCRCNLWGSNCRCQRMGLFQKWG